MAGGGDRTSEKTHVQSLLSVQLILALSGKADASGKTPSENDLCGSHVVLHRQFLYHRVLALEATP